MQSLMFQLEVCDGWPPVAKESIPVKEDGKNYKILVPPFFIKNLSVGDVISVALEDQGDVVHWQHAAMSQHSTIWLRTRGKNDISDSIECLKSLGCNIERLEQFCLFAIDVPEGACFDKIDDCLDTIPEDAADIVFPSFRHDNHSHT